MVIRERGRAVQLRESCPSCQAVIQSYIRFPFVLVRERCMRCGHILLLRNPRVSQSYFARARLCLDCDLPLPPKSHLAGTGFENLSRTCPSCWIKHRLDESGVDWNGDVLWWLGARARYRPRLPGPVDGSHPVVTLTGTR